MLLIAEICRAAFVAEKFGMLLRNGRKPFKKAKCRPCEENDRKQH